MTKYQQGCRFLQKKLEEGPRNVEIIYNEVHGRIAELMVGALYDPSTAAAHWCPQTRLDNTSARSWLNTAPTRSVKQ